MPLRGSRHRRALIAAFAMLAGAIGVAVAAPVGKLTYVEAEVDGQGPVTGLNDSYGVAVSPDGKQLYALGRDGALVTFKRSRNTGRLRFVRAQLDGEGGIEAMDRPSSIGVARDGRNVYVANDGGQDAILTFKRNRRTGRLRFVNARIDGQGGVTGIAGTCCQIAVSPDGRNVYVPGTGANAVTTFRRGGRKGKLRFVNAKADGQGGVSQLDDPIGVAVSPDGKNVYAIAEDDDAVLTFKRNRKGKLRFLNARVNGQNGVVDLVGPCCSLVASRDGKSVYVPAENGNAIVAFKRNRRTGRLRFQESNLNGQGGISGMDDPIDVAVSRDGRNVYAASYDAVSAVYTFKRARTGKLRFAAARRYSDPGLGALLGVWRLGLSPDDRNLYAAGFDADSVVVFKRRARR